MTRVSAALLMTAVLSSPAWAQGDARFCATYGVNMAGVGDLAVKKNPACLDYSKGVHDNYQSHFDWCMKQPQASVRSAETNIRRLVSTCTGNAAKPAPAPARTAAVTSGPEEPFGAKIGSWRFTQAPDKAKVICRAYHGSNIIGRYGDGRYRMSVIFKGGPKGSFEGANLGIANRDEPINVTSDGNRLYLVVGDDEISRVVRARGYRWSAWNRKGSVSFDNQVGAAVATLGDCTRANGGR